MSAETALDVQVRPDLFGAAVVEGFVPERDAPDAAASRLVRKLLWQHGVVCIRQTGPLDDAAASAVVAMIGPVKDPVGRTREGRPLRYADDRQVIDSGFVMTDEIRTAVGDVALGGDAVRPGLFEAFHTDDSYTECPAAATVLHARALPTGGGGETCFLDMRAAFDLLQLARRRAIAGLEAVHAYNNHDAFPPRPSAAGPLEELADVVHPVVRAHPVTGRPALFFDLDRATHVVGMPVDEGRALLQLLQDHAERNAPMYAHEWQRHDVLIWDNASVQHRASGNFPVGEPRRFWRYMVAGGRPTAPYWPAASAEGASNARPDGEHWVDGRGRAGRARPDSAPDG